MATVKSIQTNFTSGVLDPKLAAREDIVFFYNGLKSANNGVIIPQGGFTRRGGLQWARELAPVLAAISLSGATVTAPQGGTASLGHDGDDATFITTTGNIGTTNPFVVAHVDFTASKTVTAVDIINFKLSSGSLDDEFFVQYSTDNSAWTNFGTAFNFAGGERSRRMRNASGPVSARYWRIARIGATNTAETASIGEIRFWEEDDALSEGKLFPFAFSTEEAYMFVASDRNIDVLKGLDYHGSISIPHTSSQLAVTNYTQSLDTMLLFHGAVQTWKIFRQGGDDEFDFRLVPYENIPQYDYGAGVGGVDEIQVLNDGGIFANGDDMTILLEGERTTTIAGGATRADTAANIQTALRNLSNTSPDGILVTDDGGVGFKVTFGLTITGVQISQGTGTNFGDMTVTTGGSALAHAFNGSTNSSNTSAARKSSATFAYLGKDYSASPKVIGRAVVWPANNTGFASGISPTVTLDLYGKTGTAPANSTDGTLLGTLNFTDVDSATSRQVENAGDLNTAWDHVWVRISHNGAAADMYCAELQIYESVGANPDGRRPWDEMSVSVMSGNSVWSTSRTRKGKVPGENIMSDDRGWPGCGTFHQGRLHIGGIPGVPDAVLMSALDSSYFNFDTEIDDATKALMLRAETDQVSAIYQIIAARHLSFFTNDGEFYIPSEKIDDEVALRWTTDAGSKQGLRVHRVEGALVFIQGVKDALDPTREIATSVREFIFEETQQAYKTSLLSKLSSHLVKNPVDVALRKALSTDDADVLIMVNEDGTVTNYTVLREDSVNAFIPMTLREGDKVKSVAVDKKSRVYFITERIINGTARRYVEVSNENLYLDCGDIVTVTAESFTASDGQEEFTWTFTNPGTAAAIIVRRNGGRLDPEEYDVDLGTKTITLLDPAAEGDVVRIAKGIDEVTGLDHLTGETVQTYIDGTQGPDYEIIAGTLSLDDYADIEIQYGFDFDVTGELMPFRIPESETLAAQKIRNTAAILNLYQTSGIEIRANNGAWKPVPLSQMDDAVLDRSELELQFTGEKRISGQLGHAVGAPFEFRQPGPGPFTLLAITREVSL